MSKTVDPIELAICLMFIPEPTDRALAGWCPHRRTWRSRNKCHSQEDDLALIAAIITTEDYLS